MNRLVRMTLALVLVALMTWPEGQRYRAEYLLAGLGTQLDAVLTGQLRGSDAIAAVQLVQTRAQEANHHAPHDIRAALYEGVALLLLARTEEADAIFTRALNRGERPEHLLNYGRVRSARGDEASARQAFLRVLWTAPPAASSLPSEMRAELSVELAQFELDLNAGRVDAPLPKPTSLNQSVPHGD